MKPGGYQKSLPSRDADTPREEQIAGMREQQGIPSSKIMAPLSLAGPGLVRQPFRDTCTWEQIIRMLEEEVLRKFGLAAD